MRVSFIQIDLVMGSRILISLLQELGHEVNALQVNITYIDTLTDEELGTIFEYVKDSEAVCLSFNSFYAIIAENLAGYLKKRGMQYIITGGNHATALPDEVIAYSDIVIIYEAEITLPHVIECLENGADLSGINGILYHQGDKIIPSPKAPDIVWDLDSIPFPSIDTGVIKFFSREKGIYTPETGELFAHSNDTYFILASRGCPFSCVYCSNSLYHSLNKKFKKIRKRSIPNIIQEMEYAKEKGFLSFLITDDNFFAFSVNEISQFNKEYKERINLPFSLAGINPNNFRSSTAETKLALLLDCGLSDIRIGIQSGSNKTLNRFKRGYTGEEIRELLAVIENHAETIWQPPYDRLRIALDFICDSPWETDDDKIDTIMVAQHLLSQYSIFFYSLVFLPGTDIYQQACLNGWIENNERDIYLRGIAGIEDNIYNRVLFLIAVTKERGFTITDQVILDILKLGKSDQEMAYLLIDSYIQTVTSVEKHHRVNLNHVTLHPYLSGFIEHTKKYGEVGRKVLFRSYHHPYG